MLEDPKVLIALTSAVAGAVVGLLVSEFKEWVWRRRRRKAHWRALSAEAELCREFAEIYLRDNVKSPLYRLPTLAYLHSFPVLLADGAAGDREVRAVTQFFNHVESFNRGLDQANDARDDEKKLDQEFNRNRLKAQELVGTVGYYVTVRQVLDRRAT